MTVQSVVNSVGRDVTSDGEPLSDPFPTLKSNSASQLGPLPPRRPLLLSHWRRKQHHSVAKLPHESLVRPSARRFRERGYDVDGITAIGGSVYTEVTSNGGAAITLAASGAGKVTSFAGSVYTVATSVASAASNAVSGSGYAPTAVHYRYQN